MVQYFIRKTLDQKLAEQVQQVLDNQEELAGELSRTREELSKNQTVVIKESAFSQPSPEIVEDAFEEDAFIPKIDLKGVATISKVESEFSESNKKEVDLLKSKKKVKK